MCYRCRRPVLFWQSKGKYQYSGMNKDIPRDQFYHREGCQNQEDFMRVNRIK